MPIKFSSKERTFYTFLRDFHYIKNFYHKIEDNINTLRSRIKKIRYQAGVFFFEKVRILPERLSTNLNAVAKKFTLILYVKYF